MSKVMTTLITLSAVMADHAVQTLIASGTAIPVEQYDELRFFFYNQLVDLHAALAPADIEFDAQQNPLH